MGLFYTLRLYKGSAPTAFRDAMERTATSVNAPLIWNQKDEHQFRLANVGDIHILYIPFQDGADDFFCFALGERLKKPWMELRIQEGSLWDYALFDGANEVDTFSTLPQYWEDPDLPGPQYMKQWEGKPSVLGRLWNLPVERVDKYLVNWGYRVDPTDPDTYHTMMMGKAYPSDRAPYGDYGQFFDFLHVLGGVEPTETHSLRLPPRSQWKK